MTINWQDHHAYESEDWNLIPDWADHLANLDVKIVGIRDDTVLATIYFL